MSHAESCGARIGRGVGAPNLHVEVTHRMKMPWMCRMLLCKGIDLRSPNLFYRITWRHVQSSSSSSSRIIVISISISISIIIIIIIVITYHHVSSRIITYQHVSSRIITYQHVSSRIITYQHRSEHIKEMQGYARPA